VEPYITKLADGRQMDLEFVGTEIMVDPCDITVQEIFNNLKRI
jgi:hypothetical protein